MSEGSGVRVGVSQAAGSESLLAPGDLQYHGSGQRLRAKSKAASWVWFDMHPGAQTFDGSDRGAIDDVGSVSFPSREIRRASREATRNVIRARFRSAQKAPSRRAVSHAPTENPSPEHLPRVCRSLGNVPAGWKVAKTMDFRLGPARRTSVRAATRIPRASAADAKRVGRVQPGIWRCIEFNARSRRDHPTRDGSSGRLFWTAAWCWAPGGRTRDAAWDGQAGSV